MRRSKERLIEIDAYLTEHYPKDGSKMCSDALREPIGYIQSRIQMLKLVKDTGANNKKKSSKNTNVAVLHGKVTAKNNEIAELWELLKHQREINSDLRKENIRLVNEKMQLRIKHAKDTD